MAPFLPIDVPKNLDLYGLLPLLQRLDKRLERAIAERSLEKSLDSVDGEPEPSQTESSPTETTFLEGDGDLLAIPGDSRLAWLQQTFGLSAFDLEVLAIALAPELDGRYKQVYAYLQEDRRALRPTVDLALTLLCETSAEKLRRRRNLGTRHF